MKVWRKLTIDWPCALGDWLWMALVVAPAAFLDRLTRRSILKFALRLGFFALLVLFFQQIMAFDLSFLFYIDVAAYPEIAATLFVLVAAGFAGNRVGAAARYARVVVQNLPKRLSRFTARQHRTRARPHHGKPKKSDDEPAATWFGGACMPANA